MAHADYNCCAVCDRKLDYNDGDPRTKEEICTESLHALRNAGANVLDPQEFISWASSLPQSDLKAALERVGYSKCFYPNPFDDAISSLLSQ